jgi:hypothetical protein
LSFQRPILLPKKRDHIALLALEPSEQRDEKHLERKHGVSSRQCVAQVFRHYARRVYHDDVIEALAPDRADDTAPRRRSATAIAVLFELPGCSWRPWWSPRAQGRIARGSPRAAPRVIEPRTEASRAARRRRTPRVEPGRDCRSLNEQRAYGISGNHTALERERAPERLTNDLRRPAQ